MIERQVLQFLQQLSKNNNKTWFDAHRDQYVAAKENFIQFATRLLTDLSKIDPSLSELIARKCIFRINRDVRFSKNKDPYKSNFGVFFTPSGKSAAKAGYYFHLEPGASFIAAGLYMPIPEHLNKVRQEIDYCFNDFKKIVGSAKFKSSFGSLDMEQSLVRPPKGYDEDNPAIAFIKLKSFTCTKPLSDKEALSSDSIKNCINDYKIVSPFVKFINGALD